jgi:hypothetical protein
MPRRPHKGQYIGRTGYQDHSEGKTLPPAWHPFVCKKCGGETWRVDTGGRTSIPDRVATDVRLRCVKCDYRIVKSWY